MLKNDMLVRDGESQRRAYRGLKFKFFVAFLVMLLPLTLASETQHRLKVYVKVAGDGDNKHAVNTVESHLKRELRLLGDVDIVGETDNWVYIIEMFVLTLEFQDGRKTGRFAIAIREAYRLNELAYKYPTDYKTIQATCFGNLGAAHYPSEGLPKFCVIFVNGFEKRVLERVRAARK